MPYGVRMRNTAGPERGAWATYAKAARGLMSQSELARRLGVDRVTVYRWETSKQRPESADIVARFAEVTGVDVEEALAAAGLRPGVTAPEEPAREPDEELDLIMTAPVDNQTKQLMVQRLLERRERERQARLEDLRFMIEQAKRQAG